MFENVIKFFKSLGKNKNETKSKDAAKERLHLVLMQDRANISADFLALMKQEIIEVIKKYIDVDENAIDVRLTNKSNDDGTTGAPVLYANIPIVSVKEEAKEEARKIKTETDKLEHNAKKGKKTDSAPIMEEEQKQENAKTDSMPKKASKTANKVDQKDTAGKEEVREEKIEKKSEEKEEKKEEETQEVIEKAEEIVEEIKEETDKTNSNS